MAEAATKTHAAIGVLILLCGALMIALIVRNSLDPDNYFRYAFERKTAEPWEHPTGAVAFVALATLLESATMCFVLALTRPGRVWMRGAASLVVLVPWSAVSSAVIVHAPGFYLLHVVWLWGVLAVVVVAVTVSMAMHLFEHVMARGRPSPI
jgi:hypothetical protein